jgi:tRNA1Val (adenine37-N6)-methyltransferase
MQSLTADTFFSGRIRIKQGRSGYRFSIDAVLLAHYANPRAGDRVLDLGTGCGIIPLILSLHTSKITVIGVEVQPVLAELAAFNVRENRMDDRIRVLCGDLKLLKPEMISGPVDLVVSNPPYRKSDSGRINPDRQRAVARHEIRATLSDVIKAARRMLRPAGRFVTVYTAERTAELLTQMRSERIEPKNIRSVHSYRQSNAKLILVEGIKEGRPGTKISPPLVLYDKNGDYTEEVKHMFAS